MSGCRRHVRGRVGWAWRRSVKPSRTSRHPAATLVIAKLDRLSRNADSLLALRDSGVTFVAVDMPEANDLTVGIMALVAQAEREAISRRTKKALAVAKARRVKVGNPDGAKSLRRAGKGGVALRATVAVNATAFAANLAPVLADSKAAGHLSLCAIAAELSARGIGTRRGGVWCVGNVKGLPKGLVVRSHEATHSDALAKWRGLPAAGSISRVEVSELVRMRLTLLRPLNSDLQFHTDDENTDPDEINQLAKSVITATPGGIGPPKARNSALACDSAT